MTSRGFPDKHRELAKLVDLRRKDTFPGMIAIHEFEDGKWDLDHTIPLVVPWTKSACNLDAKLMIIGQDWISEKFLLKPRNRTPWRDTLRRQFGQDPHLPTNRNLRKLLRCFNSKWSEVYATDVSVFIKPGQMTGNVPTTLLRHCATAYVLQQVRVVRPLMVLCLGTRTFNSMRHALEYQPMQLGEARKAGRHTVDKLSGAEFYCVPHTGGSGFAACGGMPAILPIWQELALHMRKLAVVDG
jgi:hypothetical protein